MGSLNVRQWYIGQDVKFAADFASRLRLDYRYDRREGLEPLWEERQRNEFELEGRVWRRLWLGLRADPAFWKREADGGFSARWRRDPERYVGVGYTALDFDNNYSFERSNYDEGYEEIYRTPPRRYEAAAAWVWPFGLRVSGEGFVRAPSAKFYRYYYGQQTDWARRFAENHGAWLVRQAIPPHWEIYYGGETDGWAETRRFTAPPGPPATPDEEYDARLTLALHTLGVYWQPPGRHRLRGGVGRRAETRAFRYPDAPAQSRDYDKVEVTYHLLWRLRTWRELYLETGYLGERIRTGRTDVANGYRERAAWYENRAPIALEYKFGPTYAFRLSSGVDLDRRDWGQYLIYDKAFVHLIACF